MSDLKISRRYAKALLATAIERKVADDVMKDLDLIGRTGDASKDLRAMFRSPIIDADIKKQVIRDILGERIGALTMDFMMLILDKGRGHLWREIVMEYGVQLDEVHNIERIRVTSAVDLESSACEKIEAAIGVKLKKTIVATYDVDPSILGGAIIRVGDSVMDSSLRHQLVVLKEQLASA
ncbi:MAG: ATP synthase F1 subunit delta [Candidatus Kapabacteria bacterium]|nr:ATP synthase F1 subunit delta [Candidatus Kapabacteria bacterium]